MLKKHKTRSEYIQLTETIWNSKQTSDSLSGRCQTRWFNKDLDWITHCSLISQKNKGHTSPPAFWESGHGTLRSTCYRIPMCNRNVNNAAKLCALHIHWNSTIHAPKSVFLFSPNSSDQLAFFFFFSKRLISVPIQSTKPSRFCQAPAWIFPSYSSMGSCAVKCSNQIPVILLSHSRAAGSHRGKLSMYKPNQDGDFFTSIRLMWHWVEEIPFKHLQAET